MESSRRRVPWPVLSGLGLVAFVVTTRTIFTTDETLSVAQSRAEILGLASAALLILLEVAKSSDVKVRATEQVELVGVETDRCETGWEAVAKAAGLVLGVANIQTVIVWRRGSGILVEKGRIRDNLSHGFDLGRTVVDKVLTSGERAYLADLRVAPARVEFRYLPENVQAILVERLDQDTVAILGTNRARCFTGADFGWFQAIFDRMRASIPENDGP